MFLQSVPIVRYAHWGWDYELHTYIHTYIQTHTCTYPFLHGYVTMKFFVFQETLEEKFSNVQPVALSFMKVCGN